MPDGEGDAIITGLIHLSGAMPMSDMTPILSQIESGIRRRRSRGLGTTSWTTAR